MRIRILALLLRFILRRRPFFDKWSWDVDNHKWLTDSGDDDVRCWNYRYSDENKSIVLVSIRRGKHHGVTTAGSNYRYLILSGSCEFLIGEKKINKTAGGYFPVDSGTEYDYVAGKRGLIAVLFMDHEWKGEE